MVNTPMAEMRSIVQFLGMPLEYALHDRAAHTAGSWQSQWVIRNHKPARYTRNRHGGKGVRRQSSQIGPCLLTDRAEAAAMDKTVI
jgi:hypothetical protein